MLMMLMMDDDIELLALVARKVLGICCSPDLAWDKSTMSTS